MAPCKILAFALALFSTATDAAPTKINKVFMNEVLKEEKGLPATHEQVNKMLAEIHTMTDNAAARGSLRTDKRRRLSSSYCSSQDLPDGNTEQDGSEDISGSDVMSGSVSFYASYPGTPSLSMTSNICVEFTTSIGEMSMDATTDSSALGMSGVSGVGCTNCKAAIVPTMTVGVYMYYSDADSQYYVDTQIKFTGSIDFTFEFGLVDPTIAIDSDTTATLYTGTDVTITYASVISLTLTPMVTMTVGSASSVVATGTLAISAAANTEVTSTTTYKGSDNTFTPTTSQSSDISMPTLTDTSFDVTSGGSDVELTVTPYIEIVLTLGPSLLGVTFDIVSMTTKVEFPTTTKLNMADTSSCEVEFDVDVGAGLTSIEALKGTITLVGTDGICGDAPDDATADIFDISDAYDGCAGTSSASNDAGKDDDSSSATSTTIIVVATVVPIVSLIIALLIPLFAHKKKYGEMPRSCKDYLNVCMCKKAAPPLAAKDTDGNFNDINVKNETDVKIETEPSNNA